MKTENVVLNKTYAFAVRIVKLYQYLEKKHGRLSIFEQILKSGTSVGANTEEAIGGRSKAEFSSCLGIAYREARESNFWLKILRDTEYLPENLANSLLKDSDEFLKILGSILKTTKENNKK